MTKLELIQLQNEHRERNYEDEFYNTPIAKEELRDAEERAANSPVKYANLPMFECINCEVVDLKNGMIAIIPHKKGE